jgi:hypothetical protein
VHYHHTQPGILMLAVFAVVALVTRLPGTLAIFRWGQWPSWSLFAVFALECGLAWLFSSLTEEVSGAEVRWYFGPGLWDYRVVLSDIADVRTVRNTWPNGFGTRVGPGWRLYNVSGIDAVELCLKSGDLRCIGTDDPQGLTAALRSSGVPREQ